MASMKRRVEALEDERRLQTRADEGHETAGACDEFFEMQMEWTALDLVRGTEPDFTLDAAGAFVTPDGRFAVSRRRMDLQGLMGPRTEEIQEAIANTPERWARFLASAEEATDLLAQVRELAEGAAVPDDYREPMHKSHDLAEINERIGDPHGVGGSVFVDSAEREDVRRLTWTLLNDSRATAMLSDLTRRRDAFVAEEGASSG